jgi:hypothetical protein
MLFRGAEPNERVCKGGAAGTKSPRLMLVYRYGVMTKGVPAETLNLRASPRDPDVPTQEEVLMWLESA